MIKLARDINNSMPQFVVDKTKEILKSFQNLEEVENPKVVILGMAYKGNIEI